MVAVRGKASSMRTSRSIPSVLMAPRRGHSQKPEEFFDLVEKLVPGPYVELYARRVRTGWTCLGDEVYLTPEMSFEQKLEVSASTKGDMGPIGFDR